MTEDNQGHSILDSRDPPHYEVDIRSYRKGEWILKEGDYNDRFFVILNGYARILHDNKVVRILTDQDVFGLESLVLKIPSPFGARAASNCRISLYGREALDYFFKANPKMPQTLLTSVLRQLLQTSQYLVKETQPFSPEDVELRFFQDGERIIEEGTTSKEFYRLVSTEGGLSVSRGDVEIDRITQPGEFFGEMAGLLCSPRTATVTSQGESVVQIFTADQLDVIINDYPDVAAKLIKSLAARLARADKRLSE